MKKLLLAVILACVGGFAQDAEAGGYRSRSHHYDNDCDRPSYRSHYRSYRHRPVYYRTRSYRHYDNYDHCEPRYRHYSRPRVSLSFGF